MLRLSYPVKFTILLLLFPQLLVERFAASLVQFDPREDKSEARAKSRRASLLAEPGSQHRSTVKRELIARKTLPEMPEKKKIRNLERKQFQF